MVGFLGQPTRTYWLPIKLLALMQPISSWALVRDMVLETLRLTASKLKSDMSTNSTDPAYLSQADFLPHSYF